MQNSLSGRSVLVVEDEMMVLVNIEAALADLGCTAISVAASVDSALELLDTNDFDVAMLDLNLGGEPSYPVADALARRSIPFVFSTGYGQRGIKPGFGDRPVLQKPYSDQQLETVLVGLLRAVGPSVP